jgi:hypothetical protein
MGNPAYTYTATSVQRVSLIQCRKNYDVSFLFDTHSKNETEPYWRSEWGNDIKFSFSSVIVGA